MPDPTDIYDMELEEIALVSRGDNRGAHISFYKKAPEDDDDLEKASVSNKSWDGSASRWPDTNSYCSSCLIDANTGDSEKKQSLCKLPVYEPGGALNKNAVHAAASRFNQLSGVSAEDKEKARKKLVSLYSQLNEDPPSNIKKGTMEEEGIIKRVLKAVGSALGWSEEDVQKAEAVAYDPPSFDQVQADKFRYKIEDELWEYIASLQSAMTMALSSDADTESKMRDSLSQFDSAMNDAISSWSAGKSSMAKGVLLEDVDKAGRKISSKRLKNLKDARDALHRVIQEAEPEGTVEKDDDDEGMVETDVTEPIDKAAPKTLDEALARIAELEKQLAAAKGGSSDSGKKPGGTGFKKEEQEGLEDIYKDLSPELRKRFEDMEKAEQAATARIEKMEQEKEEGEYITKARADHLADPEEIGKAMRRLDKGVPEEGDFERVQKAYQAVIAQANTSELFKQRGSGMGSGSGSALAEATQKAQELRKSDPSLSLAAARAKVWEQNPDLATKYNEEVAS